MIFAISGILEGYAENRSKRTNGITKFIPGKCNSL